MTFLTEASTLKRLGLLRELVPAGNVIGLLANRAEATDAVAKELETVTRCSIPPAMAAKAATSTISIVFHTGLGTGVDEQRTAASQRRRRVHAHCPGPMWSG